MGKRLDITPIIAARLQAAYGGPVDVSQYAVFEALSLNTLPLLRRTGLYNAATITEATLTEMALLLQQGKSIPIQIMHDAWDLPVGKVFHGEVRRSPTGVAEIYTQFFVSLSEADKIAKIEDGTIDEVSVGVMFRHVRCSECGFDYKNPGEDWDALYSLTCPKGHAIGANGVHAVCDGIETFNELSLVGKGAANGTKILTRERAQGHTFALAASQRDPSGRKPSLFLHAVATKEPPMPGETPPGTPPGTPTPPPAAFDLTAIVTLSQQAATAQAQLTQANAELTTLRAQFAEATIKLAAYANEIPALETFKTQNTAMLSFLGEVYKAQQVALGTMNPQVPEKVDDLLKAVKDNATTLANAFPVGGVSKPVTAANFNQQPPKLPAAYCP